MAKIVKKQKPKAKKATAKKIASKSSVSKSKKATIAKKAPKTLRKKPTAKKTSAKSTKSKVKPKLKLKPTKKKKAPSLKTPSKKHLILKRAIENPIMSPGQYPWESEAVFNPAAINFGGRVHLFYRAMGPDGISRIGHASSEDGVNFDERLYYPVYFLEHVEEIKDHWPYTSPARPMYDTALYASGGGWGGAEDPRAVIIDGIIYMTINVFGGWHSMRIAVAQISEKDLLAKKWNWSFSYLSRFGDRQKNWVLFPEKIAGKFALFHNLDLGDPSRVGIKYMDRLDSSLAPFGSEAPDPHNLPDHVVAWHKRTRSASAPPIKTKDGWLLFYHAMDKNGSSHYKLGAMLLDLNDPRKVLYRSPNPVLEPEEWYEHDYKPGIIYASGAVEKDGMIYVYYGGGDKHIGVASVKLSDLINNIKGGNAVKLQKKKPIAVKRR